MKTSASNKKIRELISMVKEGTLIPRPEFQRRLVWTRDDKNLFLDSILRAYPFPEIYLADGTVDVNTGKGSQLLVDGLQRVMTMIQYFEGNPDLKLTTIPPYKDLDDTAKKGFLQYDVAVRDLGGINREQIVEIFQRINATKYSLLDIEVNNAVYNGALKKFAETLAADEFFTSHEVFSAVDYKRMGDLRFSLSIVITCIEGYFNRDDDFEELLQRYNDDFPLGGDLQPRLRRVFDYIVECGLPENSRVWRKSDLFTLIVELDQVLNKMSLAIQPSEAVQRLETFFQRVDSGQFDDQSPPAVYYKAALQASNDKVNRIRRGVILSGILRGEDEDTIRKTLINDRLIPSSTT